MATQETNIPPVEPIRTHHAHVLCWKSTAAGVLISIMSYLVLTALGTGILGSAARSAIENEQGGGMLATGTGLWLGLSIVVSLFLGSYFAVRMAKSVTNKVGAAHGFVVSSVFFVLLMLGAGSMVGHLSAGVGHLSDGVARHSADAVNNPLVQDTIHRAIGNAKLKADPSVVAEGLAVRLAQGDTESAKSYLAYETSMSTAEVDARIAQLKADFDQALRVAGEKSARALSDIGWTLFVTFVAGLVGGLFGGRIGAHANVERPLVAGSTPVIGTHTTPALAGQRGSILPYFFGWLLGVPMSILFMIFLLRSVF